MLGPLLLAAALTAPDPIVTVMVHVPLTGTRLPGYRRDLRRYGHVTDHIGVGTWTDSHDARAPIASERVDHLQVTTHLRTALGFLPAFLVRQRIEQRQSETLGEIFGGAYGTPQQTRTRITVRLQASAARPARLARLHRIFANNGDGGDSQYAEDGVVTDYSGVPVRDAVRIERELTRDGFAFTAGQETFITSDAAKR